ncbi:D-alanine--D-alanine ligase [Demequina sp. TTPB684]|uniref:D-alanine--D-alanine ligase family protein n=1 Tax=unclassified Demequina TaxID=2620311 RepID=UPI001CF46DC1|nr:MULTISPECIES: D-alanine--D-alanine ligase family protein [unclassified Demequina]MCB2412012.1 D-alanine--D-alanine ligase [Demequina sp. TTPB684]UPU88820.1 D-alanine--D-alanine ligase [Demequina sp. TMPB413]
MSQRRRTVAILFGGRSSEHEVSCTTAGGVLGAIDRDRWDVLAVGIGRDGSWTLQSDDPADWALTEDGMHHVVPSRRSVLLPATADSSAWRQEADGVVTALADVDVAFPLLHGPWGEDGTIQGAMELVDVRYVGSGVLASAIGMDKQFMKSAFRAQGLPVADDVVIVPGTSLADVKADVDALGYPVFVKPARAGSSMGISRVDAWENLEVAVAEAVKHDPKVLIERGMTGREIETAVLGAADGVRTSMPGEIVTGGDHRFYDFEAKYFDADHVRLECPADLPADDAERIREFAARAYASVAAEGIARVDVFYAADGTVTVNEINTMPGFTPTSMYPRMWAAAGVTYPELIEELLEAALSRPTGLR